MPAALRHGCRRRCPQATRIGTAAPSLRPPAATYGEDTGRSVIKSRLRLEGFRTDDLIRRLPKILTDFGAVLDQRLKEEIKTVQYPWPGVTQRRNGETVGSPRDIVDTGAFLRSQRRRRVNLTTIRFEWGGSGRVTYAGYIYQGISGNAYPARDWIKPALDALPIGPYFAREWRRLESAGL